MSELINKLAERGMDVKDTMSRFMGDEDLFELCFKQFSQDKGFAELGDALNAKDYDAAFRAAHSLKGVAGNLGLKNLFAAISELVETLRAKNYTADLDGMYSEIMERATELFHLS